MDRRAFLLGSSAALAVTRARADTPRLILHPDRLGFAIGADFTGLSYETAQLHDPGFFAADNLELAGFLKRLSPSGVLRIGGNTSAFSVWTPKPTGDEVVFEDAVGPDTGEKPAPRRTITPLAVTNLRGFLDASGWSLIYGLNMAAESPAAVADEAEFVMRMLGPKLVAFQLCNEPDLFYRNGLRGRDYSFKQFAGEWERFFRAVRKRVPHAPFAGPDTAFNNDWLVPFARRFKHQVNFLSQHYYAEGPPADPAMTIERLLRPNPILRDEFAGMAATQRDTALPFRMAETNSCYGGGKQGVSDSFASALWGAELMFQLAAAGGTGINFHGGGNGWYTPIAGTRKDGFVARPLYYGMLLAAAAGPGTLIDAQIDGAGDEVSAYGLKSADGLLKAILFNKSAEHDVTLAVDGAVSVLRLQAPSLEATGDVTLGGVPVGKGGAWSAMAGEKIMANSTTLILPKASAALVTFAP